ncbi:MAG TPA: hypothetical protein VHF22_05380 [Planctomycetota bacterium]|nr:hypothetical protein [Planctomycetota bacterium]
MKGVKYEPGAAARGGAGAGAAGGADAGALAPPEELEHEVEEIRERITALARELDHRRHDALDWRVHARRHKALIAAVGGGLLLLAGGTIALAVWRARLRERPLSRAARLRAALARAVARPDLVARERSPGIGEKVLATAASLVAGRVAGSLADRLAAAPPGEAA